MGPVLVFRCLSILLVFSSVSAVSFEVDLGQFNDLFQEDERSINYTFTGKEAQLSSRNNVGNNCKYEITFLVNNKEPENQVILEIMGKNSILVDYQSLNSELNFTFTSDIRVRGKFFGHFELIAVVTDQCLSHAEERFIFKGSVKRKMGPFDVVIQAMMTILVTINYINMGCQLDLKIVKATLKRPVGPVIGFLCQFTVMPLASYLVGYLLMREKTTWRFALFVLGCSPGGSSSNFWTLIFSGDLNLSITMTFLSAVAALGFMPLWLFTLGRTLTDGTEIVIPFTNLFISMIGLTSPLFVGLLIKHFRPNWAEFSKRYVKTFTIVVVLLSVTVTSIIYNFIFLMFTWTIVGAGFLIAAIGYTMGATCAWVCGLNTAQVTAVSIETAFQNAGVAFVLIIYSLPQPDSDIAIAPCIAQLMLTAQPLWLILIGIKTYNCFTKQKSRPITSQKEGDDRTSCQKDDVVLVNLYNNHPFSYNKIVEKISTQQ